MADFDSRDALDHFTAAIDEADYVYSYEIRIEGDEGDVSPYETLPPQINAVVIVYVDEDSIDYGYYEMDDEGEEHVPEVDPAAGELTEVKRKIKVNSRGVKRVKMQCAKGYKWNPLTRSCQKITGAQLAKNRKSIRRALLTKKAMGSSFKKRVIRKTKKALRFREALGLGPK